MVLVSLPLSSFSKKIILADYGHAPIQLGKGDDLLYLLCCRRPQGKDDPVSVRLSDRLDFLVSEQVAKCVKARTTGWVLHQMHLHRLCTHVQSVILAGGTAEGAIESFYQVYGLGDDDFSFESAYKRWQRFQQKRLLAGKARKIVNHRSAGGAKTVSQLRSLKVYADDASIEAFKSAFLEENPSYLHDRRGHVRKLAHKQLDCYLQRKLGGVSWRSLQRKWSCSEQNVWYSIRQFQNILHSSKALSYRFDQLLHSHFDSKA